ncbi:hypothetical protein GCM10010507_13690 [Streptomyces cinnamoneus]|uniref:Uncharacterized protein n=1 Tax=Streptomyces cinnamoneus TaxID=53446 RepID=A0A918TBN7_STRCJ|nr:hypothetical protein GCM10010507_13690 [Streptomyces cinnamoneus]
MPWGSPVPLIGPGQAGAGIARVGRNCGPRVSLELLAGYFKEFPKKMIKG